jgi:hypothetical protein
MELGENIKCLKCFSVNPSAMSYCRYCHQRFGYSSNTIDADDNEKSGSKKLFIAAASLAVLATGYLIFRQ